MEASSIGGLVGEPAKAFGASTGGRPSKSHYQKPHAQFAAFTVLTTGATLWNIGFTFGVHFGHLFGTFFFGPPGHSKRGVWEGLQN